MSPTAVIAAGETDPVRTDLGVVRVREINLASTEQGLVVTIGLARSTEVGVVEPPASDVPLDVRESLARWLG